MLTGQHVPFQKLNVKSGKVIFLYSFSIRLQLMDGMRKMNILLALMTGMITGFIFTFFKLPAPAPQVWAGVVSIAGVLAGSQLCHYILQR